MSDTKQFFEGEDPQYDTCPVQPEKKPEPAQHGDFSS